MYGEGFITLRARYRLKGCMGACVSNRCERTTCSISPDSMYSLAFTTASIKPSFVKLEEKLSKEAKGEWLKAKGERASSAFCLLPFAFCLAIILSIRLPALS